MKSMRKILLLLTMVLACSLIPAAAIAAPAPVPAASTAKTGIEQTKLTLYVGNTWQLYVYGTTKKVTWKSSKPSVAKVNSKGLITAKKAGTATITAKVGSKSYKCKVTVKKVPTAPSYPYAPKPASSSAASYSKYPATAPTYVVQAGVYRYQSNLARQFTKVVQYVPDAYWTYSNGQYTIIAGSFIYRSNAISRRNYLLSHGISASVEIR